MRQLPFILWLAVAAASVTAGHAKPAPRALEPRIAVFTLDTPREMREQILVGFLAALEDAGYRLGSDLTMDSFDAFEDERLVPGLIDRIRGGNYHLVLSIGSRSALALQERSFRALPVLVAGVFDPREGPLAGQVVEAQGIRRNYAGVALKQSAMRQFSHFRQLAPRVRRIAVLRSEDVPTYRQQYSEWMADKERLGLTDVVEVPLRPGDDAAAIVGGLAGRVDALFLPAHPSVVGVWQQIRAAVTERKIPVLSALPEPVREGALLSVYTDLAASGKVVGKMAVAVLNGADIAPMPVAFVESPQVMVNRATADALGITIPEAFAREVTSVVGEHVVFFRE